ncbi:hypothetical protein SNE40_022161 [Patella caerulea]|uniref:Uncharacterized protein n=1 Tax=Patella caerulea TaxID=87958 RepID=A0AAN8GGH3_PATCE
MALEIWYKLFHAILHLHAPKKRKRIKNYKQPEWFNSEINKARKTRDFYKRKNDHINYRLWRNTTKNLITSSKSKYIKTAIQENKDSKHIWKFFNNAMGNKKNCPYPVTIKSDNKEYDDLSDIANIMNNYFTNVTDDIKPVYNPLSNKYCEKIDKFVKTIPPDNEFTINYISCADVHKYLNMLDPSKATGIDSIGPKILRMSTDYIFESLTYIINLCISKDIFPEQLKFAKLIPIHKKEDKDLPNNYRPISVLPTISKIFEKHISSQM